ncbi:hypothetical protein BKA67DRAFT_566944 [Truncatella angustata]|uniref:Uncharacterized protein n=1 Tax=Truncatella angustata TaxID=152316 RepID=A0A9P8UI65_9PEZI|nr:uncharacterized protein BKA67DRAFT_566944 [Truncatella angustata]KAH6652581.1 hypothetical protein BKA67DRAFT_566944 [Truncatella angustata]
MTSNTALTFGQIGVAPRSRHSARSHLAEIDFSNTAEQPDCIFYSRLPAEVRTIIFEYALVPDPDLKKPYAPNRVFYRPYLRHHPKTRVALLRTCKLVFRETRLMPVAQATHYFWLFGGPWRYMKNGVHGQGDWALWARSLSEPQRAAVQHVHIFAQQFALEGLGGATVPRSWGSIATRSLRLTFRHSDWWSWESPAESSDKMGICPWLRGRTSRQDMLAQPLVLSHEQIHEQMADGTWGYQVGLVRGLQRLEIEFETDVLKKEQLEKVLDRAQHWVFPLQGRDAVLMKHGDVVESYWDGMADLKDDNAYPLQRRQSMSSFTRATKEPQRTYYTAVMTWKVVSTTRQEYVAEVPRAYS